MNANSKFEDSDTSSSSDEGLRHDESAHATEEGPGTSSGERLHSLERRPYRRLIVKAGSKKPEIEDANDEMSENEESQRTGMSFPSTEQHAIFEPSSRQETPRPRVPQDWGTEPTQYLRTDDAEPSTENGETTSKKKKGVRRVFFRRNAEKKTKGTSQYVAREHSARVLSLAEDFRFESDHDQSSSNATTRPGTSRARKSGGSTVKGATNSMGEPRGFRKFRGLQMPRFLRSQNAKEESILLISTLGNTMNSEASSTKTTNTTIASAGASSLNVSDIFIDETEVVVSSVDSDNFDNDIDVTMDPLSDFSLIHGPRERSFRQEISSSRKRRRLEELERRIRITSLERRRGLVSNVDSLDDGILMGGPESPVGSSFSPLATSSFVEGSQLPEDYQPDGPIANPSPQCSASGGPIASCGSAVPVTDDTNDGGAMGEDREMVLPHSFQFSRSNVNVDDEEVVDDIAEADRNLTNPPSTENHHPFVSYLERFRRLLHDIREHAIHFFRTAAMSGRRFSAIDEEKHSFLWRLSLEAVIIEIGSKYSRTLGLRDGNLSLQIGAYEGIPMIRHRNNIDLEYFSSSLAQIFLGRENLTLRQKIDFGNALEVVICIVVLGSVLLHLYMESNLIRLTRSSKYKRKKRLQSYWSDPEFEANIFWKKMSAEDVFQLVCDQ